MGTKALAMMLNTAGKNKHNIVYRNWDGYPVGFGQWLVDHMTNNFENFKQMCGEVRNVDIPDLSPDVLDKKEFDFEPIEVDIDVMTKKQISNLAEYFAGCNYVYIVDLETKTINYYSLFLKYTEEDNKFERICSDIMDLASELDNERKQQQT